MQNSFEHLEFPLWVDGRENLIRLVEFLTNSHLDKMTDVNAPKDPYKLAFIIFYWLGTGSLLPWNFFIAVNEYWNDKFRNTTIPANATNQELSELQVQWASNLSIASMIPNVIFLFLNAFIGHKFRSQPRLLAALVIIILLFTFSDVMTQVNTDTWQYEFLVVTLFTVVVINIMVAIFQGGLSGLAGKFPPSYMGAVVQGQALGGIFAAATNVIMIACGASAVSAAFPDFLIAVIFLISALVAFIILTRTEFYQYYALGISATEKANEEDEQLCNGGGDSQDATKTILKTSTWTIFKQIWVWIVSVFICFLVTLAAFPAITVLVKSSDTETEWGTKYFIPVACFLVFNVGDFLGRMLAGIVQWPKSTHCGSLFILALSVARIAFIPLFLFCNAAPLNRNMTQVYIESDIAYIAFMVVFSLTNGYIGSIAMMYGPKMLSNGEDQGRAASLLVSFLVLGLAVGAALSKYVVGLL